MVYQVIILLLMINSSYVSTTNLRFGRKQSDDEFLTWDSILIDNDLLACKSFVETFADEKGRTITRVNVTDWTNSKKNKARAVVIAGGPGHSFITIEFYGCEKTRIDFKIELYGK
ncbi:hypothetical protein QAD02_010122 [Eretmocerus hayati]|uniref:Uncharacterized protein n=1 Tax=Eretmocerus hayati TaxID=131215 RepID=A0ACC2NBN0_9HYME|nr:hypothetical protein QAD02_010122 [Eretmocerus hayati]